MATLDEMKRKTRTTAMMVALSGMTLAQAQDNAVAEVDTIRSEMSLDARQADIVRENPRTYLDVKTNIEKKLSAQFNSPVLDINRQVPTEKTVIGPFPGFVATDELDTDFKKYKSNLKSINPEIVHDIREVTSKDDLFEYNGLAHFDPNDTKIYQPQWLISKELQEEIQKLSPSWTSNLLLGDIPANIATFYHEKAHSFHHIRGQTDVMLRNYQTPDMRVEKNFVTEKVAYTIQCLSLANIWKHCKDAGIETIELNQTKKNLSDILNPIPELKEEIEKNGFDYNSAASLSRVINIAAKSWDNDYLDTYTHSQFIDEARNAGSSNIMNQIIAAREHKQILIDMTKNLDIGYGVKIDIPDDCIPLIMPTKDFTQNLTSRYTSFSPSTDGLLAIDNYLNTLNIKSDKEKDKYIRKHYENIVNRSADADLKLKNLMLRCCNKNNNMIYYTDNIQERNIDGIQTISPDLGKNTYTISRLDERIDQVQKREKSIENSDHKSPKTKVLTLAEISSASCHQER